MAAEKCRGDRQKVEVGENKEPKLKVQKEKCLRPQITNSGLAPGCSGFSPSLSGKYYPNFRDNETNLKTMNYTAQVS